MNSRYVPEELSHYPDYLVSVLLKAPDGFTSFDACPVNQRAALREAFEVLQEAFPLLERKLKDETLAPVLRETAYHAL